MQPCIRLATLTDIPDMYSISFRAHQTSYADLIPSSSRRAFDKRYAFSKDTYEKYRKRLTLNIIHENWRPLVAEVNGKVVGYTLDERFHELLLQKRGLFIDPDYQGAGTGSRLFTQSLLGLPRGCLIRLSVIQNNDHAIRLYKRNGFVISKLSDKTFFGAKLVVMERVVD